jgi:tripartite-type tricarboxylate transporter receptor subunit TctC
MSKRLGKSVIVENKAGGFGVIAAREAMNSPADGYTITLFSNGTASSVPLSKNLPFDPVKDFAPVANIVYFDFLLVVGASSPYQTMKDFIADARQSPAKLNTSGPPRAARPRTWLRNSSSRQPERTSAF